MTGLNPGKEDEKLMIYIDTCSYNDYDTVIRFLLAHNIQIVSRDKVKMAIAAEVPEALLPQLHALELEEFLSVGTKALS